jgi:hypothetical protein
MRMPLGHFDAQQSSRTSDVGKASSRACMRKISRLLGHQNLRMSSLRRQIAGISRALEEDKVDNIGIRGVTQARADPNNAALVRQNLELNGITRQALEAAIGPSEGKLDLTPANSLILEDYRKMARCRCH